MRHSLGIEEALAPVLRRVDVPESSLLIFYTDGVTEHDRKALTGAAELHDAAIFAYNFASLPSAGVIERQMGLSAANYDDAAILTAWTPPEDRLAIGGSTPALMIAARA
jgi:Stage II sporulation protein E (SpoIIE)